MSQQALFFFGLFLVAAGNNGKVNEPRTDINGPYQNKQNNPVW